MYMITHIVGLISTVIVKSSIHNNLYSTWCVCVRRGVVVLRRRIKHDIALTRNKRGASG